MPAFWLAFRRNTLCSSLVVGLRLWLQWTYGKAGVGCLSALLRFTALSEALNTTAQCSRALFQIAQACLDVKMFTSVYVPARSHQRPPWARWQIWSLGPPRHILYAFENVSILLNLFLSPTWEWTLAERWLADKKQVETKKKVNFQHFIAPVGNGNPPAATGTFSSPLEILEKHSLCMAPWMLS